MILYIVRHAVAFPHGTPGVTEYDRPLTEDGIEKMDGIARGLKAIKVRPDLILSSPLVRALQTAEILQRILGEEIPLKTVDSLAPSGSRRGIYQSIRDEAEPRSIMLVGHQPLLGEIAGEIAWGTARNYFELKKGAVVCLEAEFQRSMLRGTLLWCVTPAILRAIQ